jgi:hypothetical protein
MTIHNPKDRSKSFKKAYENARILIKELATNLQQDSTFGPTYHHFYIRDLGGLSLNKEEAIKYFNFVHKLHDSLPDKEYYDLNSVTSIVNEAILKTLDLLQRQQTIPFKKRLNSALEELANALHAPPDAWEVHYTVEGLSLKRLPIIIGKIEFYTANKARIRSLSNRVDYIYRNTSYPNGQQKGNCSEFPGAKDLIG